MKLLGARSLSSFLKVLLDIAYYGLIAAAVLIGLVLVAASFVTRGAQMSEEYPISFALEPSAYEMRSAVGPDVTAEIVQASGTLRVVHRGAHRPLARLLIVVPVLGITLWVVHRLRGLFRRLNEGRPFAKENAATLRFIGLAVLGGEVAWAAIVFSVTRMLAGDFEVSGVVLQSNFVLRAPVLLTGLVVLVIAEVFRMGAEMKADLDTAREIQFALVPSPDFEKGPVSIHSRMQPARTVGGDYYDVVELDDGRIAFVVADVAGKGIPAALLMTLLQGSLRSLLSSGLRGAELVTRLNAYLVDNTPANRMITFFYGELDPGSGELRYVNAGHNPPILRTGSGVRRLEPTGVVLGVLDGAPFAEERTSLAAGERLLLYTDGVSEAANPAGEEFGDERLERLLDGALEPKRLLDSIVDAVLAFCGKAKPHDDMTMMVVSRA